MNRLLTWILFTLFCLVVLAGCTKNDDTSPQADSGTPQTDAGPDASADAAPDDVVDAGKPAPVGEDTLEVKDCTDLAAGARMAGTWGMLINGVMFQTGIAIINDHRIAVRSFYLVEMASDGAGNYTAQETLCGMKFMPEYHPEVQWSVGEDYIANAPVLDRKVSSMPDSPGDAWVSDTVWDVRGANLADAATDILPDRGTYDVVSCDEADAGAPCDQDLDGEVGVTVQWEGPLKCSAYVSQRWSTKLSGSIIDCNTIEGDILDSYFEQTTLDAAYINCRLGNHRTIDIFDSCPDNFYFKMIRLGAGSTCADLLVQTSCYDNEATCAGDATYPLNPKADAIEQCDAGL